MQIFVSLPLSLETDTDMKSSPATRTLTGVQPGEAMLVAIAPDGARESFLIQVKQ